MKVQCGWCKKWLKEKAPLYDMSVSHTICPGCRDTLLAKYVPSGSLKETIEKLKEAS